MPRPCVLVFDDDIDIRESLASILEDEGHDVTTSVKGLDALGQMRRGPLPDLILLDLVMPAMTGWEFRAEQRGDRELANVPVIVIKAGWAGPAEVTSLLGAVDLIRSRWTWNGCFRVSSASRVARRAAPVDERLTSPRFAPHPHGFPFVDFTAAPAAAVQL